MLSDLHLNESNPSFRSDQIIDTSLSKLKTILEYAKNNDVECILQAGDWHNKPRGYKLLENEIKLLQDNPIPIPIYCVYGQHDMYFRSKKFTNLNILNELGLVKVLTNNPIEINNVRIYGESWGDSFEYELDHYFTNILVTHKNIGEKPLFINHDYTNVYEFVKQHNFDLILCGDIHRYFLIDDNKKYIINAGTLVRNNIDDFIHTQKNNAFIVDISSIIESVTPVEIIKYNNDILSEMYEKNRSVKELFKDMKKTVSEEIKSIDFLLSNQLIKSLSLKERIVEITKQYNSNQRIIDFIDKLIGE